MRYRLRTLLIVLSLGPPLIAAAWFSAFDLDARDRAIFVGLLVAGLFVAVAVAATCLAFSARRR